LRDVAFRRERTNAWNSPRESDSAKPVQHPERVKTGAGKPGRSHRDRKGQMARRGSLKGKGLRPSAPRLAGPASRPPGWCNGFHTSAGDCNPPARDGSLKR